MHHACCALLPMLLARPARSFITIPNTFIMLKRSWMLCAFKHYLILLILGLSSILHAEITCPSQYVNDRSNQVFSYPLDIYQENREIAEGESEYYCLSVDRNYPSLHRCSYKYFCPLNDQNIKDADIISWNVSQTLCTFKQAQVEMDMHRRHIQVVLLGGSVTAGMATMGCCCMAENGNSCPATSLCGDEQYLRSRPKVGYLSSYFCSWGMHLERFLKDTFTHVTFHNLGFGSVDSNNMGENIENTLKDNNIHLQEEDIVLLDFSVNDGTMLMRGHPQAHQHVQEGVERLIRRIIRASDHRPTIIFLEMMSLNNAYAEIYTSIARYYGLHLWSMRAMLDTDYSRTHQAAYHTYLTFEHNQKRNIHPPWHVGMFYSDLVSNLLLRELQALDCTNFNRSVLPSTLPPPLTKKKVKSCSLEFPPMLDLEFSREDFDFDSMNATTTPVGAWRHYEDRYRKFGLISEGKNGEPANLIEIPFGRPPLTGQFYNIFLRFMRTYLNAGIAAVSICNNYLGMLDSLWDNFESFNVSMSFDQLIEIDSRLIDTSCRGWPQPVIQFENYFVRESKNRAKAAARGALQKFKLQSIRICLATLLDEDNTDI